MKLGLLLLALSACAVGVETPMPPDAACIPAPAPDPGGQLPRLKDPCPPPDAGRESGMPPDGPNETDTWAPPYPDEPPIVPPDVCPKPPCPWRVMP